MSEWIYEFYKTNENFHTYVDKYCIQRGYGLFEALRHSIVMEVASYYKKEG